MTTTAQATKTRRAKAPDSRLFEDSKECTKCKAILPFSCFSPSSKIKSGYYSWCKPCCVKAVQERNKKASDERKQKLAEYRAAYNKKYWQEKRDVLAQKNKEYREKNKDLLTALTNKYYQENKERWYQYNLEYRKANKGKINNWVRTRRKSLNQRSFPEQKKAIDDFYQNCPPDHHVDHIVPITHPLVCGLHVIANLQYLPARENCKKRNRFDIE